MDTTTRRRRRQRRLQTALMPRIELGIDIDQVMADLLHTGGRRQSSAILDRRGSR